MVNGLARLSHMIMGPRQSHDQLETVPALMRVIDFDGTLPGWVGDCSEVAGAVKVDQLWVAMLTMRSAETAIGEWALIPRTGFTRWDLRRRRAGEAAPRRAV